MSELKTLRLNKVAKELNVGLGTLVDFLNSHGHKIENNPNAKIDEAQYALLLKEYQSEKITKEKSQKLNISVPKETVTIEQRQKGNKAEDVTEDATEEILIKDISLGNKAGEKEKETVQPVAEEKPREEEPEEKVIKAKTEAKHELKVLGKIDLDTDKKGKKKETKKEEVKTKKEQVQEEPVKKEEPAPVEIPQTEKITSEEEKPVKEEKEKENTEKPEEKEVTVAAEKKEEKQPEKEPEPTKGEETEEKKDDVIRATVEKLGGPVILGKIELPKETSKKNPLQEMHGEFLEQKKAKRKRIRKEGVKKVDPTTVKPDPTKKDGANTGGNNNNNNNRGRNNNNNRRGAREAKPELTEEEIQKQVKETLARLSERTKGKHVKIRKEKKEFIRGKMEEEALKKEAEKSVLKVTEFVSANELAQMMDVNVTDIISACMSLGLFVSINQRLDAETINIIAEEFGYSVDFVSADITNQVKEVEDAPDDLESRYPVVTVMGHVDHGKTSLLDHIRKSNVIAGEAGGITQHIGAYAVELESGRHITFIDTPGHEAFTAMRARGAQVTDVAIIVIAADDSVMPQTIEAINHAKAANVPIVFAINKIDKPGANPDKIREALAAMNYLVEEWGGKYQCQEVSAKQGLNIELLLDKVLLEADMLDLKANPNKRASGTVIEAQLDKGRGFMTTLLVQNGTLNVGDVVLAGPYSGRVKAMFNERGSKVQTAPPGTPIRLLGLTGAPQAGDKFNVMEDEREARDIAAKRLQLQREQGMRTKKHITLDKIGRRIAIGDFQQLNIIIKGDTDGSIEALSDSLLKLSTENIQVNIIHKSVGAISESDVLLASASDAIIVGFQVRPSINAKKLAEKEEIDIRLYSVIYQAIEEIKSAMEGVLAPELEEKVTGNIEVREVFTITKVGTVAGCYVLDGKVYRTSKVRVIRDGIVIHTGKLSSLKRFKDDVKEVAYGYECGLTIDKFNNLQPLDIIEAFEVVEVKRKL